MHIAWDISPSPSACVFYVYTYHAPLIQTLSSGLFEAHLSWLRLLLLLLVVLVLELVFYIIFLIKKTISCTLSVHANIEIYYKKHRCFCERVIRSCRGWAVFGSLFSVAHPGICDYPLTATEGAFLTLSAIMRERLTMPSSHFLSPPPSPLFTHSSSASWLHSSTRLSSCSTISSVIMAVMTAASFCLDVSPLFCLWMHHVARDSLVALFYSPVPQVHTMYSTYYSNNNNWVIIPNLPLNLTLTHVVILYCPVLSYVGTL